MLLKLLHICTDKRLISKDMLLYSVFTNEDNEALINNNNKLSNNNHIE